MIIRSHSMMPQPTSPTSMRLSTSSRGQITAVCFAQPRQKSQWILMALCFTTQMKISMIVGPMTRIICMILSLPIQYLTADSLTYVQTSSSKTTTRKSSLERMDTTHVPNIDLFGMRWCTTCASLDLRIDETIWSNMSYGGDALFQVQGKPGVTKGWKNVVVPDSKWFLVSLVWPKSKDLQETIDSTRPPMKWRHL